MSGKAVLVICAQALLIQSVFSQCIGRAGFDYGGYGLGAPLGLAGRGLANPAYGPASPFAYNGLTSYPGKQSCNGLYPAMDFIPTSGGGFPVTSASAIPPTGISIISENAFEGILAVNGELPFVGSTAVEGVLPTIGAGAINHGCGNGLNVMTALSASSSPASIATTNFAAPYGSLATAAYAPAIPASAYAAPAIPACAYAAPAIPASAYAAPAIPACAYAAPAIPASAYAAPAFAAPAVSYEALVLGTPCGTAEAIEITPTSGGALPVSSSSVVPPTGISVASETAYEGPLSVAGELPFVGTVGIDGMLPTAGSGAVNHACGNGVNAMVSKGAGFASGYRSGFAPAAGKALGYGYPAGFGGRAYGCN